MKEVLYVISGKRLPVVFHVGARALTSQALNIHAGHDDVMGVADTGWGILFARNAQEAADLTAIARRVAEATQTPFFVVQDGFLTTHTLENVRLPEDELLRSFVGDPRERIDGLFDPDSALMTGVVQNQDSYMKGRIGQRAYYAALPAALTRAMDEWAAADRPAVRRHRRLPLRRRRRDHRRDGHHRRHRQRRGRRAARATVGRSARVGVTSFRPFPAAALADGARRRAGRRRRRADRRPGRRRQPADPRDQGRAVRAARRTGAGCRGSSSVSAGLGLPRRRRRRPGRHLRLARGPSQPGDPQFGVVGVRHPLAVPPRPIDISPAGSFALRGHSIGGLGSITTNKLLATLMGEVFGKHVQAYPRYGSEKKGLPDELLPDHRRRADPRPRRVAAGRPRLAPRRLAPSRWAIPSPAWSMAGRCSSSHR